MDGPGRPGGMGLRIMRYRAEMCGGALRIEPATPAGTVIHCTFKSRTPDAPDKTSDSG